MKAEGMSWTRRWESNFCGIGSAAGTADEKHLAVSQRTLKSKKGAVALANIFCWAAALLYAQMGEKSVVISLPSLINTVHSQTSLSACLISNCFVFNH